MIRQGVDRGSHLGVAHALVPLAAMLAESDQGVSSHGSDRWPGRADRLCYVILFGFAMLIARFTPTTWHLSLLQATITLFFFWNIPLLDSDPDSCFARDGLFFSNFELTQPILIYLREINCVSPTWSLFWWRCSLMSSCLYSLYLSFKYSLRFKI
jgi:hypothetical protein